MISNEIDELLSRMVSMGVFEPEQAELAGKLLNPPQVLILDAETVGPHHTNYAAIEARIMAHTLPNYYSVTDHCTRIDEMCVSDDGGRRWFPIHDILEFEGYHHKLMDDPKIAVLEDNDTGEDKRRKLGRLNHRDRRHQSADAKAEQIAAFVAKRKRK